MRVLLLPIAALLVSGCAGPITAWKGRAYGEHSIEDGEVLIMAGDRRLGRVMRNEEKERLALCLERRPEIYGAMSGSSKPSIQLAEFETFGTEESANMALLKAHEATEKVQLADMAYNVSCESWMNGILDTKDHKANVMALVTSINALLIMPPAKPEPKAPNAEEAKKAADAAKAAADSAAKASAEASKASKAALDMALSVAQQQTTLTMAAAQQAQQTQNQ